LKKGIKEGLEKHSKYPFHYADSEYEAINQLSEEIINPYKDVKEDRENLGPLPQKWLAFLEEAIRES